MTVQGARKERKRLLYLFLLIVVVAGLYQAAQVVQKQNWCNAHQADINSIVSASGMPSDSACSLLYDRR